MNYEVNQCTGINVTCTEDGGDVWDVPYTMTIYETDPVISPEYAWTLAFKYIRNYAATYNGHSFESVKLDEGDGPGVYTITVRYSKKGDKIEEENGGGGNYGKLSFSTKGGTGRQQFSKERKFTNVANTDLSTPPDFNGGMNVRQGIPEGCDVKAPALRINLSIKLPAETVNNQFIKSFWAMTAKVNSDAIWWLDPGELLFLGVDGQPEETANGIWYNLNFEFEGMPNVNNNVPPFGITPKDGWDYLWILREDKDDAVSKRTISKPVGLYVERVYDRTSFAVFDAFLAGTRLKIKNHQQDREDGKTVFSNEV